MSWSIAVIQNNLPITPECAAALFAAQNGFIWDDAEEVVYQGKLYFNSDHSEHMDYLHNHEVLGVLETFKVNGEVTFGSLEGDNRGKFWGYRFKDGVLTKLDGQVLYTEVKPKPAAKSKAKR